MQTLLALAFLPVHLLLATLAAPPVDGDASCPRPDEVAALLPSMLPGPSGDSPEGPYGSPAGGADHAQILARGLETFVQLKDGNGAILDESALEGNCAERARRAAVLLAIWETRLRVDVPAPRPDLRPVVVPPVGAVRTTAAPISGPRGAGARIGAGFVAVVHAAGITPAGMIELQGQAWPSRVWGRLAVAALAQETMALGQGQATWSRLTLGGGGLVDLGRGRITTALRGGMLVSRFSARGSGFDPNQHGTGWQLGVDVGARLSLRRWEKANVWLELAAVAWPGQQTFSAENVSQNRFLPALEGHLALGGGFLLGR
ncbi:MAG TPA: hypothetical protein VFH73_12360 [Polyangia bacterium]|nr:hypothetical protein [Polyangia bacterium]